MLLEQDLSKDLELCDFDLQYLNPYTCTISITAFVSDKESHNNCLTTIMSVFSILFFLNPFIFNLKSLLVMVTDDITHT